MAGMAKKQTALSPDTQEQPDDQALTFEQAYRELEQVVEQLERGDLPLEQALALHTRGQQLAALCSLQLDRAELRVKQLEVAQE